MSAHSKILTEAGTNEVEVLVFRLNEGRYGVNVAKVREIIASVALTRMPESHPAVRGMFRLRDRVLPLVDLRRYFNMPPIESETETRVIVMEFNDTRLGFLVDHVDRIFRVSWSELNAIEWSFGAEDQSVTGVLHIDESLVLMLDFERVAFRIAGVDRLEEPDKPGKGSRRDQIVVLLAEDSVTMRTMLSASLQAARFKAVELTNDGQHCWERLNEMLESGQRPDVVVTDIEMPRMDGLHLTKKIKEDPRLKDIPVIVFSSLVSDDNLKKCASVGADSQITKPQLPRLVQIIDELLKSRAATCA